MRASWASCMAILRFKANLFFALCFLQVLEFAFGFVIGAFVGGLVAQEEG